MAQARIYTNQDIVNGLATVCIGAPACMSYDGGNHTRTQHIPSGDSLTFFQDLDRRYRNRGGPNGSGNWETI